MRPQSVAQVASPSDATDYLARQGNLTTAQVTGTLPTGPADEDVTLVDLTSVIQELIDQPGYKVGGAWNIYILGSDNAGNNAQPYYSRDTSAEHPPRLEIAYTPARPPRRPRDLSGATTQGVRAYVHDGMLRRIGELGAFDITRSYLLGRVATASFSVLASERLLPYLDPDLGASVVIESDVYRVPWVGYVSSLSGSATSSAVTVSCREWSALLEQRYLPDSYETSGAMADEFRRVLDTVNARNDTLIRLGAVEERAINVSGLRLSNRTAASALDLMAGISLMEWYVDYPGGRSVCRPTLHLVTERGTDRTADIEWDAGDAGNAVLTSWAKRAGALPAVALAIGGDASGAESFDARPRAQAVSRSGAGRGLLLGAQSRTHPALAHGYQRFTAKTSAPATRIEQTVMEDGAIDVTSVASAADALVARPTFAERTVNLHLLAECDWSSVRVGDAIRLRLPVPLAGAGPAGIGRVAAVAPMEAQRSASVECELLVAHD